MRPMLDDLDLPQVQEIATHDRRVLAEHKPPGMAGSVTSLVFGTQSMFSVLMLAIGGPIADRFGLPAVFYMLAVTVFIANVVVFMLPKGPAKPVVLQQ